MGLSSLILNDKYLSSDLGSSTFESPLEEETSLFTKFLNLFGMGSGSDGCSSNPVCGTNHCQYPTQISNDNELDFFDKMCDIFGYIVPESGGAYYCTDPSKLAPPPFISD